jgi:hypothetical protein
MPAESGDHTDARNAPVLEEDGRPATRLIGSLEIIMSFWFRLRLHSAECPI